MATNRPVDETSHLYLVDASGYIFRAFHALPPLTRKSDGLPIGAVAGFCNMLWKLLEDLKAGERPTHFACVFDKSEHTFRNELYNAYKAHRPPAPEELAPQFPIVRRAALAFGTPAIEMIGFEADDLIATYARAAEKRGARVTIVSSDKDLMQLVTDRICLLDTMKDRRIWAAEVEEKFGVPPNKVVDVQALCGDSVDNVPGVPGIGVKTAAQLILEYGDLETLLARTGEIKQPKRRESLVEHAEKARISKVLVTLRDDVDVPEPLDALGVTDPEPGLLLAFLAEMEFRTLHKRITEALGMEGGSIAIASSPASQGLGAEERAPGDQSGFIFRPVAPPAAPFDPEGYSLVQDIAALAEWIAKAHRIGVAAIAGAIATTSVHGPELVGLGLSVAPGRACYVPLAHGGSTDLLAGDRRPQIPLQDAVRLMEPLLRDRAVLKVGHDIKPLVRALHELGVELSAIDDTMLLSFVLDAGRNGHELGDLAELHLGLTPVTLKDVTGSGRTQVTLSQASLESAARHFAGAADISLRLWATLRRRLPLEHVTSVCETMDRPLIQITADMEAEGVLIDREHLSRLSGEFALRMGALEAEARALAGHDFNLGSPKQIGDILFGEMGLPGAKKTKTGAWATGAELLEDLAAEGHLLPRVLLEWRMLSKLRSTYTDTLREAINPVTGRVHTTFSLAGAQTGRLSSTDPNLQNIPVRTEEGRKIREAFVAPPGFVLVSADYSQIELRLLAHVADIPALRLAFQNGVDIHAMTASEMFGVPVEGMDPMVRRQAKAINFGIIYGISAFGLARQLSIPRDEASTYIKAYFEKFPGIRDYMNRCRDYAREHGHVQTIFGRKIWLPQIKAANAAERSFAERQAINAPLQGSAADIIKRAMIRIPPAIAAAGLKSRMLLQVHDELVFEAPQDEAERLKALARDVMARACHPVLELAVPLVVEAKQGLTWAQAH